MPSLLSKTCLHRNTLETCLTLVQDHPPGTGLALLASLRCVGADKLAPPVEAEDVVLEALGFDCVEVVRDPLGRGVVLPLPGFALFQTFTRTLKTSNVSLQSSHPSK